VHVIEVLGTGCSECLRLDLIAARAVAQAGVEAEVRQVTDRRRIAAYGVFTTPGLAIDGALASTGRVPLAAEIADWLRSV
jgi:small redox-active disulfide protein 2